MKRGSGRGSVRLGRATLFAIAVALAALITVGVLAARSRPTSCGYALPQATLSDALRAQGGFDQAYNGNDTAGLQELAQRGASADAPDLIGVTPLRPVTVHGQDPTMPDALVVALRGSAGPSGSTAGSPIRGLVVFLSDCSGGVHFNRVVDLGSAGPSQFPAVDEAAAQGQLHGPATLIYTVDPIHPSWRSVTGATAAGG